MQNRQQMPLLRENMSVNDAVKMFLVEDIIL